MKLTKYTREKWLALNHAFTKLISDLEHTAVGFKSFIKTQWNIENLLSNPNRKTSGSLVELKRTVIHLGVYTVCLVLPVNLQYLIMTNSVLIKTY